MLRIDNLIDDAKCYQSVRQLRWPQGVRCAWCQSEQVRRRGLHQRHHCKACGSDFDDLTNTVFARYRYNRLPEWGYGHRKDCHGCGEFARDEDGDGFCEVHVNTIGGF